MKIRVERHKGPDWFFEEEVVKNIGVRWQYKTKNNLYRLFVERDWLMIWIGRLDPQDACWFTAEKMIGATAVHLSNGVFLFDQSYRRNRK